MLVVEVSDYINWGRECYHRRLTMVGEPEPVPPLYPIPGEEKGEGGAGGGGRMGIATSKPLVAWICKPRYLQESTNSSWAPQLIRAAVGHAVLGR